MQNERIKEWETMHLKSLRRMSWRRGEENRREEEAMMNSSAVCNTSALNKTISTLTVQHRTMACHVISCYYTLYRTHTTRLHNIVPNVIHSLPGHAVSYHIIEYRTSSCPVIHVKHSFWVTLTNIHQSPHWMCIFHFCGICMNCSSLFVSTWTPVRMYVLSNFWPNS